MKCSGSHFLIFGRFVSMAMLLLAGVSGLAQDYSYDAGGNLSNDVNKKIQSIHYNYLNLADTIIFEDGRKITYTYIATGQKLSEHVINAEQKVVRKADYLGGLLYNNDSLRQIFQGIGRVVPVLAGNLATPWEYQYGQTDLVGNVRALLTSRQDVDNDKATFETANQAVEQNRFLRYEDTRLINSILFDHTNIGSTYYSERLNGSPNEKYGLAKSVSVMAGDVVNLDVFAKYTDPDRSHWQDALINLVTAIANGTAQFGTVVDGSGYATSGSTTFPMAGLNGTSTSTGPGPKAYLNWLVFDRNFVFKKGGYVRMTDKAKEDGSIVEHEQLSTQVTIDEPGYVYAYPSNEETSPVDVFFDDFTVELVKGPVVQQTDYDPFGLVVTELTREHAESNNFLYNGKELQKDFDLNWYDYGARMYDAALGRWHVIDPMAEVLISWSPFAYVSNNPILKRDPDGRLERDENGYVVFQYKDQAGVITGADHALYRGVTIKTDDGTEVDAFKLYAGASNNRANCHGVTFTDGDFWVGNKQALIVLDGDGYQPIERGQAKVGDVVIISIPDPDGGKRGLVIHSVRVSKVTTSKGKEGKTTNITVRGKAGNMPDITEDNIDVLVANALDFKVEDQRIPDEVYKKAKATYYRPTHPQKTPDRKKEPPHPPEPPAYIDTLKK